MAKELKNFRQGDTKIIQLNYGVGINITGYKFWFTLRAAFEGALVAQVSTVAGDDAAAPDLLDEPANGIAYIVMGSDITKAVATQKYFWDIQRLKPATTPPDILTLFPTEKNLKDKLEVLPQVTLVDI